MVRKNVVIANFFTLSCGKILNIRINFRKIESYSYICNMIIECDQ